MVLSELKDLERLFKLCRKHGVSDMDIQGIKFKMGDVPQGTIRDSQSVDIDSDNPLEGFPNRILTPDELIYYSSGGLSGQEPPEVSKQ